MSRKRPLVVCAATAILAFQGWVSVLAQQCDPGLTWVGYAGYVCQGGGCGDLKVHVRVKIEASGAVRTAIEQAIEAWNSYSGVTNTVFEPAGDNPYHVMFSEDPSKFCGASYNTTQIKFASNMETVTNNNPSHGKWVFIHELGHFFALAEESPTASNTVMAQVDTHGLPCVEAFQQYPPATLEPTPADVAAASACAKARRQANEFYGLPTGIRNSNVGDGTYCYDVYEIVEVYDCYVEWGCIYVYSFEIYHGRYCPY